MDRGEVCGGEMDGGELGVGKLLLDQMLLDELGSLSGDFSENLAPYALISTLSPPHLPLPILPPSHPPQTPPPPQQPRSRPPNQDLVPIPHAYMLETHGAAFSDLTDAALGSADGGVAREVGDDDAGGVGCRGRGRRGGRD